MGISKDGLKAALVEALSSKPGSKDEALDAIAGAIVDYLRDNLEVKVPGGKYVTTVTGQVTTLRSNAKVDCEVS